MSALAKVENVQSPVAVTPMEMLDRAIERGATPETLAKLMELQERFEKNEARKAFDEAIANAKAEIPPIIRNASGHNAKKYADFAQIARTVDPILSKHGLSYRFRSDESDRIKVTCILSHKQGHSEETTLSGPADNSGNKNAVQAIGSTLTYLQRYTLVQALGLAASNDDDGHSAGADEPISAEQLAELIRQLDDAGADKIAFCKLMKIDALADLPKGRFAEACGKIATKRAQAARKAASAS